MRWEKKSTCFLASVFLGNQEVKCVGSMVGDKAGTMFPIGLRGLLNEKENPLEMNKGVFQQSRKSSQEWEWQLHA